MTRTQVLLVVLACVLLLAWLTGGSRVVVSRGAAAATPAGAAAAKLAVAGLSDFRSRLGSGAVPLSPSRRNLFAFAAKPPSRSIVRHASTGTPTAQSSPPGRPEMRLIGVAEDVEGGRAVRTALISVGGELFFVCEAERLLGRYEVVRVSADAVALKDGDAAFALALR